MKFQEGRDIVYLWLIHVDIWQKPKQYHKSVILQLKIHTFKSFPAWIFIPCPNKRSILSLTGSHGFEKWLPMTSLFAANESFTLCDNFPWCCLWLNTHQEANPFWIGNESCERLCPAPAEQFLSVAPFPISEKWTCWHLTGLRPENQSLPKAVSSEEASD